MHARTHVLMNVPANNVKMSTVSKKRPIRFMYIPLLGGLSILKVSAINRRCVNRLIYALKYGLRPGWG